MAKKSRRTPPPQGNAALTGILPLALLITITAVAYWNSLNGSFHFDDQGIFLDPYVVGSGFGWKILRLSQTRPLTFLTFHWNYLATGNDPWTFHLISVMLHAANSVLVMLIARTRLRPDVAWFAGALYALHPLQTQPVNYVFERATLLAAFFALLSLLLFVREKYLWAVVAFAVSLLAKEETTALPVLLLLYTALHLRRAIAWRWCAVMFGFSALAAARLAYAVQQARDPQLGFGQGVSAVSYALTQSRVIWAYLRLFLLPSGLNLDHDVKLSQTVLSPPQTLAAVLLLMMLVGTLIWLVWRRNDAAFWAIGFFVLLAPSSSVIPVRDVMFEHRTYFPLACLVIAAAVLIAQVRPAVPIASLLLLVSLVATIARNRVWHDEVSLWTDVVEKAPGKSRGYFQLAQATASTDGARARQLYERGLEIEPNNPTGQTNLGLILLSQGDADNALQHLRKALVGGNQPLVWNNIGSAELRLDHIDEGIRAFRRALEGDPCRFDARWNLIHTLAYLGQKNEAVTAGQLPPNCVYLPEQSQRLRDELQAVQ